MTTSTVSQQGRGRAVAISAVAAMIGLFTFVGVRVKETLADRKAMSSSLGEHTQQGQKHAAAVAVVHGIPRAWRPRIPVTGTLAPVQDADVGFKTGGRLVAVRAKVGDHVKGGQLLAALDVSEAQAQVAATSAGVRAAQVGYEMARDAEKRTVALFEQKAVSDAENLGAMNRAALALAQLEQARAQAQLASVGVGNGTLSAPFSGLVTRAPSGVGKIVAPGEAMFHVEDTQVLKLNATLSETDARLVEVGAEIRVDGEDSATPIDGSGKGVAAGTRGRVTAVLGSLDAQTRRVPMLAEIPNDASPPLLAGAFVRATILSTRETQVLMLPASALRPGSQDEVVVLAAGRARLVHVLYTAAPDGSLLVRSGITPVDTIVASPSSEVRDGDELGVAAP